MIGRATTSLPSLHPAHLEKLRASALTEETIAAARLHSARPQDLDRLAGRPVPSGTTGLVIPYDESFARVRFFPPIPNADGRAQKYGQPLGTPPRLYVPPGVAPILADPDRELYLTEGEFKALALTQHGFPCVALGGVDCFRSRDLPPDALLPELEAVAWTGRVVLLVFDADAWTNEHVLRALFRLGRLLEARGARVLLVRLPALPNLEKTGADDYLVAHGPHAFRRLVRRAHTLGYPAFRLLREREKAKTRPGTPASLPATLAARRIHPAIHFDPDGFAAVGILTAAGAEIITSTSERFPAEAVAAALASPAMEYEDLRDRWCPEDLARFLARADAPPTFADAVAWMVERLEALLELGGDREAALLACWAVASYFAPAFLAFPRLDLRGEPGTGKSKALSILAATAFNGLLRVSPTPAVLFRLAERLRPTLCLDEIEGLAGDDKREVLAVLNAGYKRGGRVDRCEGDDHTVKSYSIYAPVALAGITGLNRVTEDRAITLVLSRGMDPAKVNADVDPTDRRWAEIRDLGYRLALLRWRDVAKEDRSHRLPEWLGARERELWRPLLAVAALADREGGLGLVPDLLALAKTQGEERAGLSDEGAALVEILDERLSGGRELVISPGDLCEPLKAALKWEKAPSPGTVGRWLKRLGFPPAPRCAGGKRRLVTRDALDEVLRRYKGPGEQMVH